MSLAAIGLFLVAYQWGNQLKQDMRGPPTLSGVMVRPAQPLPDFVLSDSAGAELARSDLLGHWSLIAFAPLGTVSGHRGITRMVGVYNRLADQPTLQGRLRLLLVSADSAPRLARDFERLSPAIAILHGDRDQLDLLRDALGASPEPTDDTAVPPLFLSDPDARLTALFPPSQPDAEIAADVAALADWPGADASQSDD
jgi:peroxiredoxin